MYSFSASYFLVIDRFKGIRQRPTQLLSLLVKPLSGLQMCTRIHSKLWAKTRTSHFEPEGSLSLGCRESVTPSFYAILSLYSDLFTTGKSIFLYYIWNLRRHLNLPTLYMPTGEIAWVWKENQYFQIQLSSCTKEDLQRFLPENTWCLVDSSQNVVDVPQNVYNTRRFILQASEPRKDGLLWIEKAPIRVTYFAMREWTAAEFIAGYVRT